MNEYMIILTDFDFVDTFSDKMSWLFHFASLRYMVAYRFVLLALKNVIIPSVVLRKIKT